MNPRKKNEIHSWKMFIVEKKKRKKRLSFILSVPFFSRSIHFSEIGKRNNSNEKTRSQHQFCLRGYKTIFEVFYTCTLLKIIPVMSFRIQYNQNSYNKNCITLSGSITNFIKPLFVSWEWQIEIRTFRLSSHSIRQTNSSTLTY